MLHSGHVAFFEEASKLGELYVGLGSDQTIYELKARQTINKNAERLYMVKALRCVKDAWINSGSGIMDFEKEVRELKPDIFFVNSDGYTPAKKAYATSSESSWSSANGFRAPAFRPVPLRLCGRSAGFPTGWNFAAAGWISRKSIPSAKVPSSS